MKRVGAAAAGPALRYEWDADRLFAALSEGGEVESAMADQFWGDYWGACKDRFGVQWMFNVSSQQ